MKTQIFALAISARNRYTGDIAIASIAVQCTSKESAIGYGIIEAKKIWSQPENIEHQCSTYLVPEEWYMNDK